MYRGEDGTYTFRTIGNNGFGVLGQGRDVKESSNLRLVHFPEPLLSVEQVTVGLNHFFVRANNKVFVWGCYNQDSVERIVWRPTEVPFFN
jgi:hypothetical protein